MAISNILRRALTVALNPSAAHRELIALLDALRAGDVYFIASEAIAADQIVTPVGASSLELTVALAQIQDPGPFYVAREGVAAGEVLRCGTSAVLPIDTTIVAFQTIGNPVYLDPATPGGSIFLGGGRLLGFCLTTGASGTYLFETHASHNFRGLGVVDEVFLNDTGGALDGGDWMQSTNGGVGLTLFRLMEQGGTTADAPNTLGVLMGDTPDETWGVVRRQGIVYPPTMAPIASLWGINIAGNPIQYTALQKNAVAGQAEAAGTTTQRAIGVTITFPGTGGVEVRCRG